MDAPFLRGFAMSPAPSRLKRTIWYVILFVPFFVAIWVPLLQPHRAFSLYGIPFFYWFQFVLIVVAAASPAAAYKAKI